VYTTRFNGILDVGFDMSPDNVIILHVLSASSGVFPLIADNPIVIAEHISNPIKYTIPLGLKLNIEFNTK
jgi:hypothetical protein